MTRLRLWNPRLLVLVLAAGGIPLFFGVSGESPAVRDPETEIAASRADLDSILRRLEAGREESRRPGLGPQTAAADRALYNARELFERREWLSVIRELNAYLNLSQVPELKPYLNAQYMLGRSYEEAGYSNKALRAYFRYLASFLTCKDGNHDELLDVLRRMLPIAAKDSSTTNQLNELLASVTNLDFPASVRPAIFFAAAKAAATNGNAGLATRFDDVVVDGAGTKTLKARGLYLRALLALGAKDYDRAEDVLGEVILAAGDQDLLTRDLARLALGRLAVKRKKHETALKYYTSIGDDSPSFKDALFESVYIHLELKQDGEARTKALQFVARFPDEPVTFQIKTLLAYLDLRAGDLDSAQASVEAADKNLASISSFMGQKLRGKGRLDHDTLTEFNALSDGHLQQIPTVSAGLQLFSRLGEAARHLADARGELRNVVFTIGRVQLDQLRPQWVNRAEQLALLGDEVLKVGHRLAGAERNLYKPRLDPVDWQALTASEERRTRLLTPQADLRRRMHYWPAYASMMDLNNDVGATDRKLKTARAEIAASRYLLQEKPEDARQNRLSELEATADRLDKTLAKGLELLRKKKVEELLDQAPHRAAKKFLSQYAVALHDESEIIKKARDGARDTAQRLLAEDAGSAWKRWQFVATELFQELDGLDAEVKTGLTSMLTDIEKHEAEYDRLGASLADVTQRLESELGLSLASIVDQYSGAIDQHMARHKKWRADMEWLRFQGKVQDEGKLSARFNLEQQILKDNLTDLEQGVLWSWPK